MEAWSSSLQFAQIGEQFGTPLYIFSPQQLQQNFQAYLTVVSHPTDIAYPVKTNPSIEVLRQLYKLGSSIDCASLSEVSLALSTGFPPERILFNSPATTLAEAVDLLKQGCTVIADSVELLHQLNATYSSPPQGKLFIRVNPAIPIEYAHREDWQSVTAHGSSAAKFGIPSESIVAVLKTVSIPVCGLQVHVGTQMDNLESFVNVIRFLHTLVDDIHAHTSHQIDYLDLGGGLGIDFVAGDRYPTIQELAHALAPLKRENITYWVEPGQSLVGNTMGLLTKVVALKELRGKRWAIVDVGSDQLIKITLLNWYHQILRADHQPLAMEGKDAVGGPLCFSGDTLLPTTDLEGVQTGDYLFIQHCGAYCYAVSNHFNGRSYAGMVKLDQMGRVKRCNDAESDQLSPTYATYQWQQDFPQWVVPKPIGAAIANCLNSNYLQHQAALDRYEITAFHQLSENWFEYEFAISSEVSFVSMPFALRLIADATIVTVMYCVGKDYKDISVWGDELVLNCAQQIRSNRVIRCQIALSPFKVVNRRCTALAQFSLDDGKFSGSVRPVFRLDTASVGKAQTTEPLEKLISCMQSPEPAIASN